MKESEFQSKLIKELKIMFPGCVVLKNDANYIQGFPDLLILHGDRWAALECKRDANSPLQPNQDIYISCLSQMSYANIIHPDNKEMVLHEVQRTFRGS